MVNYFKCAKEILESRRLSYNYNQASTDPRFAGKYQTRQNTPSMLQLSKLGNELSSERGNKTAELAVHLQTLAASAKDLGSI